MQFFAYNLADYLFHYNMNLFISLQFVGVWTFTYLFPVIRSYIVSFLTFLTFYIFEIYNNVGLSILLSRLIASTFYMSSSLKHFLLGDSKSCSDSSFLLVLYIKLTYSICI